MISFPHPGRPLASAYAGSRFADWVSVPNVFEALAYVATQQPAHIAVSALAGGAAGAPRRDVTYPQLRDGVARAANALRRLGVERGDVVAYLLPSLLETQYVLWGAETAGIAFPVNPLLNAEEIAALARAAGVKVLVAPGPGLPGGLWGKAQQVRALAPGITTLAALGGCGDAAGPGEVDFLAAWQAAPDRLEFDDRAGLDTPAAIFHTGGTTGMPKLVVHTHGNQLAAAYGGAAAIEAGPADTMANGLPMFHVAATIFAGLSMLMAGARVLLLAPSGFRDPELVQRFWQIVEDEGATIVGGVPTALAAVVALPPGPDCDLSRIRVNVSGASSTPRAVAQDMERLTSRPLHEIYGMTECAGVICVDPASGPRVLGSAGLPIPFCEVQVRALDAQGRPDAVCPRGMPGVLVVRGPNVSPGYRNPAHNTDLFTPDGWLVTGDLGYVDTDGRVFIRGRAKDLIIRGGHNIDPAVIEECLARHPVVTAAAAVGMPDTYAGEVPVAYVTLRADAGLSVPGEAELLDFAAQHIGEPPAAPRRVFITRELPLTAVGKVHKPTLRNDAARRHFLEVLQGTPLARLEVDDHAQQGRTVRMALESCLDEPLRVRSAVHESLRGYDITIAWEEDAGAPPVAL
ncbi:MAG: AMP-binding protein [Ramlibacter sp.]|nr:AMP-binding protein [Ramlibacter sp.]